MKKFWINALVLLVFASLLSLFIKIKESRAQEVIQNFNVEITIEKDGSLLVKELITVNAELDKIKHGLYRSIPTLTWKNKVLHQYDITLLEATLDNKPVQCRTKKHDLLTTFILGDPKQTLTKGTHVFRLVYRTTGHIFKEDADYAINYHVTGSFWEFDILNAQLVLFTQPGINLTKALAYVTKNQEFEAECQTLTPQSFRIQSPLKARESMVLRAHFVAPNLSLPRASLRESLSTHSSLILSLVFAIPIIIFGFWGLRLGLGVKPKVKEITAIPEGLTPGLCACVADQSKNAGVADLLWLMVCGYLRLENRAANVRFIPTKPAHPLNTWQDSACLNIVSELFSAKKSDTNATKKSKDSQDLEGEDLNTLFRNLKIRTQKTQQEFQDLHAVNYMHLWLTFLLNMLLLYAALYCVGWLGIYDGESLTDYFFGLVCAAAVAGATIPFMPRKTGFLMSLAKITLGCFSVLGLGYLTEWDMQFFLPALSCLTTPLLFWLIFGTRLTAKGLELKATVEGVAQYLTAINPNTKDQKPTVEKLKQYQELLPYSFALGLDQTFKEEWQEILKLKQTSELKDEFNDYFFFYVQEDQDFHSFDQGYEEILSLLQSTAYTYGSAQADTSSSDSSDSGSSDGGGGGW